MEKRAISAIQPASSLCQRQHRLVTVLTIVALAILMGRQRPADFVRLGQQLNQRQREALSLDADHANHETARTIVQSGGDYLIQLKNNCPAIRAQAAQALQGKPPLFSPTTTSTTAPNIVR